MLSSVYTSQVRPHDHPSRDHGHGSDTGPALTVYVPENKLQPVITAQLYLHAHFLAKCEVVSPGDLGRPRYTKTI